MSAIEYVLAWVIFGAVIDLDLCKNFDAAMEAGRRSQCDAPADWKAWS